MLRSHTGARSLGRQILLKAAGRLSKQPDVLQREEVLQKAPQLQSTSKERAFKCWSNKDSSNARDMFVPSHTRWGCLQAAQGTDLGGQPLACTNGSGAERGPGCPWVPKTGSDNKPHREHLGSAGRINNIRLPPLPSLGSPSRLGARQQHHS